MHFFNQAHYGATDWNPAFATMENVQDSGAQLVSMSATSGEIVRLEYRIGSVAQASRLTSQLNAGFPAPVWRLEAVTAAPQLGLMSGAEMQATWSARLTQLR